LKRRALAASDIVLCVSNYTARKLIDATKIDPKRCKVIYNTFDERFRVGDRLASRKKFSMSESSIIISTVSRLDPSQRHKGHDRVIPLLKGLAEDYPNLVYLVAGTGGDRSRLEELAYNSGAGDIVRFLGFVADEDLPDLYRASDLYVMPSHGEGFGIAFVEAMACGTPAIGLDKGGAVDALSMYNLGTAVTEDELFAAIHTALATPKCEFANLSKETYDTFGRARFDIRLENAMSSIGLI
jgi:phosphatidylinositol alpha-1,6-mannosyltransferase